MTDHQDLRKLLPCPFCGGNAEFGVIPYERKYTGDDCRINHDHGGEFIQCANSDCSASSMLIFPTMADAKPLLMEKWNRRARITAALAEKVEPPKWYTRNEIVHALHLMKYSDEIAQELADWFVRHLQGAFNKGFQMASRNAAPADQWRRVEDGLPEGE